MPSHFHLFLNFLSINTKIDDNILYAAKITETSGSILTLLVKKMFGFDDYVYLLLLHPLLYADVLWQHRRNCVPDIS
jgi:hypothetical protein